MLTFTPAILSGLVQSFPAAPPPAEGALTVNLTPPGIASGWRFVGETLWRAAGTTATALTSGNREVEFRPIPGYIQPPRVAPEMVSGGATVLGELDYYEAADNTGNGGISVGLKPDALAAPGVPVATRAQWRLLGGDDPQWQDSESTLSALPAGNYLIEAKPVAGRTTPPPAAVMVADGAVRLAALAYLLTDPVSGALPQAVPFSTVSTDQTKPFAYSGQLRSDAGLSRGFVVKPRVVATAAHVVWNDGTLSAATGLQWLFQRDKGAYDPKPQIPRGFYIHNDVL